ncbi:MAG: HPr family phosphocarrier protein [Gammaproteobacteria bacterium]|nr:HPr family phosphocarrier protein [Gammaproteobacteria bacterium]MCY4227541.1 HPr family phosphocarrier protein [Gammaproteobacteria bacterium]MCY4312931.1 HPr family phosphocarrier protein [Gammaproteobacteria bacterium]
MRLEQDIRVINKLGLHTRAAAKLAKLCSRFESSIEIASSKRRADAKSIMSVMMLAACQGTELKMVVEGEDAAEALRQINDLFESCFEERE